MAVWAEKQAGFLLMFAGFSMADGRWPMVDDVSQAPVLAARAAIVTNSP